MRRATRDGAAILAELDDATPRRRSCFTRFRSGWRGCGSTSSGPTRRGRCWLRSTSRPSRRCGSTRWSRPWTTSARVFRCPRRPAAGWHMAWWSTVHSTRTAQSCGGKARSCRSHVARCCRAHVLAPAPGDRVLDLCSAPGAKATQLAALMGAAGELVCVEVNSRRADGLRRTLRGCMPGRRDGARRRRGESLVARRRSFDRVLVDPPCSGLGTLQSRPDLRWRTSPERVVETAALQAGSWRRRGRRGGRAASSSIRSARSLVQRARRSPTGSLRDNRGFTPDPFEGCDPGQGISATAATLGWHRRVLHRAFRRR